MTSQQKRQHCERLKKSARKFASMGMYDSFNRTVREHNAIAHKYNREHKIKIGLL